MFHMPFRAKISSRSSSDSHGATLFLDQRPMTNLTSCWEQRVPMFSLLKLKLNLFKSPALKAQAAAANANETTPWDLVWFLTSLWCHYSGPFLRITLILEAHSWNQNILNQQRSARKQRHLRGNLVLFLLQQTSRFLLRRCGAPVDYQLFSWQHA